MPAGRPKSFGATAWLLFKTESIYAVMPLVFACITWAWLNGRWFYIWMPSIFGDIPISHPGYNVAAEIFQRAPYIAAGVICGISVGICDGNLARIIPRLLAPLTFIGILLETGESHAPYIIPNFILPFLVFCIAGMIWSAIYARIKSLFEVGHL